MRIGSNTLFCIALGCASLMKAFAIQDAIVGLAIFSVGLAVILTNLMRIRSIGLAGVGSLSLVYTALSGRSIPGTTLTVIVTVLTSTAVILAILADFPQHSKGEEKTHEI